MARPPQARAAPPLCRRRCRRRALFEVGGLHFHDELRREPGHSAEQIRSERVVSRRHTAGRPSRNPQLKRPTATPNVSTRGPVPTFTPKRSLVRSQYRPRRSEARFEIFEPGLRRMYSSEVQLRLVVGASPALLPDVPGRVTGRGRRPVSQGCGARHPLARRRRPARNLSERPRRPLQLCQTRSFDRPRLP
jgi:hypothetical protein